MTQHTITLTPEKVSKAIASLTRAGIETSALAMWQKAEAFFAGEPSAVSVEVEYETWSAIIAETGNAIAEGLRRTEWETMTRAELNSASVSAWNLGDYDESDAIEAVIARRFPFDNAKFQADYRASMERYRGILAPVDNSDVLNG